MSHAESSPHHNEAGASAVEYGMLVAAIAAVIVLVVFALGGLVNDSFSETCSSISSGTSISANCAPQHHDED